MKLFASAALAVLLACPAWAQIPGHESGSGNYMRDTILCDTAEQLETILNAQKDSFDAGVIAYRIMRAQKNEHGDAACYYFDMETPLPVRFVETVTFIEGVKFPRKVTDLYILEIRWPFGDGDWIPGYIFSEKPIVPAGDPV